jgi:DNA-binding XRE family transcriptional regulator
VEEIGEKIKAIRVEKIIEIKDMAGWLQLTSQAYTNIENGKRIFH